MDLEIGDRLALLQSVMTVFEIGDMGVPAIVDRITNRGNPVFHFN
jgi:hypothetical protein